MEPNNMEHVGLAFMYTLAASLATTIGSAGAFFARVQDRIVLAASLGLSAGVMLFVSFVEIFSESREAFSKSPSTTNPLVLTTIYFFLGMMVVAVLDILVHIFGGGHGHSHSIELDSKRSASSDPTKVGAQNRHDAVNEAARPHGDIVVDVKQASRTPCPNSTSMENDRDLRRASLVAAMAVALHNIPEGLTTFMSTLSNPKVGLSVTIGIGIHNVLEGLCIAMPLYFATGSRWRAFLWSTASGIAEFLGAVLGYLVFRSFMNDYISGVVFALVAGMMVLVSMRELLPIARRYDPQDRVVTWSLLSGMALMAFSLVLVGEK